MVPRGKSYKARGEQWDKERERKRYEEEWQDDLVYPICVPTTPKH